jgi:ribonuclease VapC
VQADYVLDASALLAWLHHEQGSERVEGILELSAVSAVNLSEVLQKGLQAGADVSGLKEDLEALGVEVLVFGPADAELAAALWPATRHLGLSLADRACLATAKRLKVPAVTADREWEKVEGVQVEVIR